MKVGLYNLEPHIVNSAMMRVSSYHKKQGDHAEIYQPVFHRTYDIVYAFSIFSFTKKYYVHDSMNKGGTGFGDLTKHLPPEIEQEEYDWSLYPDCDFSIVWFSTGCIRACPFCVVQKKEGWIKPVEPKNLNPNGKYIKVMDNNFFANPKWREAVDQLRAWNQPVDFQGVDVRIITEEMCKALNSLTIRKQIKIAWDNPRDDIVPRIKEMLKFIKPWKIMCYVLIGFWSTPEEDMRRIEDLRSLKIDPFVMPFNKRDSYQKNFARWVNHKAIFGSVPWDEYKWQKSSKTVRNRLKTA
jgi:hypothetical protein